MNITMNKNETELTIAIEGRLDTFTSPELEEQFEPALEGEAVQDFYIVGK